MSESGSVSFNAASIVLPTQPEEMFPVRLNEWGRLRQKISDLKQKRRQWSNIGWGLIGIGVSAGLSWLPYFTAGTAERVIPVVTAIVSLTALATGVMSLVFSGDAHKSVVVAVRDVHVHMHDMETVLTDEQKARVREIASMVVAD